MVVKKQRFFDMKILLTFDVEEFDYIKDENEKFELSKQGLLSITNLLDKHKIKATFFTTALFAKKYSILIKNLEAKGHEIACHGYCHLDSYLKDISKIKEAKKEIESLGIKISGFRAPRYELKNTAGIGEFGFIYDSSLHPTWIPGRYFNFFKNREIHKIGNIIEVPLSVLPITRLQIFWLAFKNFGANYAKIFTKINSLFSDYTMLVFHPWEFINLKNLKLKWYVKRKYGRELLNMLENYLLFCLKNKYKFETISNYLEKSVK
jgi:hypothetical protein